MKGFRWQLWAMVLALGLVAGCKKDKVEETDKEQEAREQAEQAQAEHDARLVSKHFGKVLYVTADAGEESTEGEGNVRDCSSWDNGCTFNQAIEMVREHKPEMMDREPKQDSEQDPEQDLESSDDLEGSSSQTTATSDGTEGKDKSYKGGRKKGGDKKGKIYIAIEAGEDVTHEIEDGLSLNLNVLPVRELVFAAHAKSEGEALMPEPKASENNEETEEGEESEANNRAMLKSKVGEQQNLFMFDMGESKTKAKLVFRGLEITGHSGKFSMFKAQVGQRSQLEFDDVKITKNNTKAFVVTKKIKDTDFGLVAALKDTVNTMIQYAEGKPVVQINSAGRVRFNKVMVEENEAELAAVVSVESLNLHLFSGSLSAYKGTEKREPIGRGKIEALKVNGEFRVENSFFKGNKSTMVTVELRDNTTGIRFKEDPEKWGMKSIVLANDNKILVLPQKAGALYANSDLWLLKTEFNDNTMDGVQWKNATTSKTYLKDGSFAPAVLVSYAEQIRQLKETKFSSNSQNLQELEVVLDKQAGSSDPMLNFGYWKVKEGESSSESRDGVVAMDLLQENAQPAVGGLGVAADQIVGIAAAKAGDAITAVGGSNFILSDDDEFSEAVISSL